MLKEEEKKTFIVDATPVNLDFNFYRNKKKKERLETLNLKWSYSSLKGFYIGFKTTIVINYDIMDPIRILIYYKTPNDAKLLTLLWKISKKDV